jgi:hypothetical protein
VDLGANRQPDLPTFSTAASFAVPAGCSDESCVAIGRWFVDAEDIFFEVWMRCGCVPWSSFESGWWRLLSQLTLKGSHGWVGIGFSTTRFMVSLQVVVAGVIRLPIASKMHELCCLEADARLKAMIPFQRAFAGVVSSLQTNADLYIAVKDTVPAVGLVLVAAILVNCCCKCLLLVCRR